MITEMGKVKVPFVLALLAAMFSVTPLIQRYGDVTSSLFGVRVSVDFVYVVFCLILGSSVYFYGVGLVCENRLSRSADKIGDVLYAVALTIPPLFCLSYPMSELVAIVVRLSRSSIINAVMDYLVSSLLGLAAIIWAVNVVLAFAARDRRARVAKLMVEENGLLLRARELLEREYYDLSVAEAWRAIEVSLIRALETAHVNVDRTNVKSLLNAVLNRHLISADQGEVLKCIRDMRNAAVHTDLQITKADAVSVLKKAEKVIAWLDRGDD